MSDRRDVQYNSMDEFIDDAKRLASGEVRTEGNYTYGQILDHLTQVLKVVLGEIEPPRVPLPMRLVGRMMKWFVLNRPMAPGFKLPQAAQDVFWSTDDVDVDRALQEFVEAAHRFENATSLPKHPFFGKLTREEHLKLQLNHGALHMSFVRPVSEV